MIQTLFLLEQIFMLWMLWDAIKRRSEMYWYLIIILPFGEWFYFFTVKINDPEMQRLKARLPFGGKKAPTVEVLRHQVTQTPSLANKIRYAQALHDHGDFRTAAESFQEVLKRDPQRKEALLGSGLCLQQLDDTDGAIARFRQLIEHDSSCFDYEPWVHLARSQWAKPDQQAAIDTLSRLVEVSPRLKHRFVLAQLLGQSGQAPEARSTLEAGLLAYDHAPKFLQRRERSPARQAKTLLKQLAEGSVWV